MRYLLCLTLFVSLTLSSFAQLKEAAPETVGASSERLKRIDNLLQEYIDKKWVGGATAIVVKDGKIIYYKALGLSDLDNKTAMKKDAIFRIASQTKAITSVAIMMLYEEGKLLLDDPVSRYIPSFANQKVLDKFNEADSSYTTVPAKRPVTIRDLLTHTSGIGYAQIGSKEATAIYAKNGIWGGIGVENGMILGDKIKVLGTLPLLHQPGEQWTYGLNSDVLGYVIEVLSGMSLDVFFKTRIFEPLGMKDTYFYLPKEKYSRLVTLNTEDKNREVVTMKESLNISGKININYPAAPGTYYSGGGGLSSTALDYAIFMQMLVNNGEYNGKRILSPFAIRMMTTSQFDKLNWPDTKMGLGFSLYTDKSVARSPLSPGSFEWGGMFSSTYWIDPKEKLVAQLFLNQYPNSHGEIHDKFKVAVYQTLER
ncbi:MAG: beta-lactamase family protein [Sphingobacteriales bacterium]|nr:beta-lactamase family protein [Sphingobacteriales bacterium]OJW01741.1 MAG: serine hydrolase [Sphingobacteriales bacterium 44-61]